MAPTAASIILALWAWPGVILGALAFTVLVERALRLKPLCSNAVKVVLAILAIGLAVFLSEPVTIPADRLADILEQQRNEHERRLREIAREPHLRAIAGALREELSKSK